MRSTRSLLGALCEANGADEPPFEAVLLFYEPSDWQLELQAVG